MPVRMCWNWVTHTLPWEWMQNGTAALGNCLADSVTRKCATSLQCSGCTQDICPREMKACVRSHRNLNMIVQSSFILNSFKLQTTQTFFTGRSSHTCCSAAIGGTDTDVARNLQRESEWEDPSPCDSTSEHSWNDRSMETENRSVGVRGGGI